MDTEQGNERVSPSGVAPQPISITADDREYRSAVMAELCAAPAFEITVARLPVGDYRVDNRFLFERKTLPDLVDAIKSGRLFGQALRLAEVRDWRPALVLEGTAKDLRDRGMRWEALQGALITVSLFIGLPVLRTRSARETVQTFQYAAMQGRTAASGALPRRGNRPKGKRAVQHHVLQGLPGVGPERAARLLERFGSVEAVFNAEARALASVRGIGRRTARAMRWAVEERGAIYRVAPAAGLVARSHHDAPASGTTLGHGGSMSGT